MIPEVGDCAVPSRDVLDKVAERQSSHDLTALFRFSQPRYDS